MGKTGLKYIPMSEVRNKLNTSNPNIDMVDFFKQEAIFHLITNAATD